MIKKIFFLIGLTIFYCFILSSQNLLKNSSFDNGDQNFPNERYQFDKVSNWILYKGHKFVDWFYWDLNSPLNDGNKINAYYYDNPGYPGNCEIDISPGNQTNFCNRFKQNPYSPIKDTAIRNGGFGCEDTIFLAKLMKPSLSKYNHIRGNHFIGIQGDNLNDIGIQQEFPYYLKEGNYKLSFNFAIHTKYQDSKIKFYLSKEKNKQGKKIFSLKAYNDKFYYDNTIYYMQPGKWIYHEKIINVDKNNKYKWLVITSEACGPFSFSPNSQYIYLDFIKFEPVNCSQNNIYIEDELLYDENYHAKNYTNIKNTTIKKNAEVYIKAGNLIEIEGNFVTEDSVTFYAEIMTCNENNRIGDTASFLLGNDLSDMKKNYNQLFIVYPNPSAGIFTIESEEPINPQQIKVYDIFGKRIQPVINQNDNMLNLNLTGYSKGMYFIRIGTYNQKIVVE